MNKTQKGAWVGLFLVVFFVFGPQASMQVFWLPLIFGGAGITVYIVHSAAILVQYGKGVKDHE